MVIADTGAVYALIDRSDAWHQRVISWWRDAADEIILPMSILPEVTYLLQTRIGPTAEEAFVRSIANGDFVTEPIKVADLSRIADLMGRYRNLPLGYVDASVVAVAERLEAQDVLTTDRRHFAVVQPQHARGFVLLP
ncbi:MAG: PIN domain-containing protein [Nevskiaceae bacterium]|jgi:predicted nucleic acid-binding protein|nr:PIN domain-containing protein [Nevskiaceae bacterium]